MAAAVVLLWAVFSGLSAGKGRAAGKLVLGNADSLVSGLKTFYGDQDRFPTAAEFQGDRSLMLNYFESFPPFDLVLGKCPASFAYQRPSLKNFKLQFCLPRETGGWPEGWSQITEDFSR